MVVMPVKIKALSQFPTLGHNPTFARCWGVALWSGATKIGLEICP